MKKPHISLFLTITAMFFSFTLGFFLGRNPAAGTISVSVPPALQTIPTESTAPAAQTSAPTQGISFPIDINTATEEDFQALPGIGEVLAQRIVAYRQEHGTFRTVEELMNVEGIGEKRIAQILDLITIGG